MNFPAGFVFRTNYIRILNHVWQNQEIRDGFLIWLSQHPNDIKPIIILDENTKKAKCLIPNSNLTGFELAPIGLDTMLLCRKVEAISDYFINKVMVQECKVTPAEEKERMCKCLEERDYLHKKLKAEDEKFVEDKLKEIRR